MTIVISNPPTSGTPIQLSNKWSLDIPAVTGFYWMMSPVGYSAVVWVDRMSDVDPRMAFWTFGSEDPWLIKQAEGNAFCGPLVAPA